jgi:UDP-apiose/xylose synthase
MGPIHAQRWSYASAKQLLERVIYAYGEQNLLEYTIIRPFNFIGSRMDFIPGFDGSGIPRVIACFMESLILNKPLKLVDGGKNTRSFTSIHDAVEAIIKIIELPEQSKNQIFNIGNPENELTIYKLAELFISLYKELYPDKNFTSKIIEVPAEKFYGKGYEDSDKRVPDISKAIRLLGWKPKMNIRDALKETIVSYFNYYGKKKAA